MYRKRLSFILCFLSFGCFIAANQVRTDSSGAARLANILANNETGLAAYNKINVSPADVQNLPVDLYLREASRAMGCRTVCGEAYLEENLKNPHNSQDKAAVLRKQKIIKTLVENPALKKKVDEFLLLAREYEQDVITFYSDTFKNQRSGELARLDITKVEYPIMYPVSKFLTAQDFGRSIYTLITAGTGIYGTANGVFKSVSDTVSCAEKALAGTTETIKIIALKKALSGTTETIQESTTSPMGFALQAAGSGTWASILSMTFCYTLYSFYHDYANASVKRSKMHGLSKLVEIAKEIEALSAEHSIETQFKVSDIQDEKGIDLLDALNQPRYTEKTSNFFALPLVHTMSYKLYTHDKQLAPVFACIAEMDAYNALATKIIASKDATNKFCFVNYIDDEKPRIEAKSFWNVLVKNAVVNDMKEDKNVILTGPNAGGKSTAIRALLLNIVLAQTFGVAAAEEFNLTMFDVIHSYLNVSDDILNGDSLFKAEVKRAQSILQKIKSLNPNQKYFFALDELFTGTGAEYGEQCAHQFIKRLAHYKNVQFLYATHFDKLKLMGYTNAAFTNYQVDAPAKNDDGKLVYPFTLSQGASTVNIALDIAAEAGLFDEDVDYEEAAALDELLAED